jgi:hypothetical protein
VPWTAPVEVTLTCPVCGNTEVATGQGTISSSFVEGVTRTVLTYNAQVPHECSGITPPEWPPPA